MEKGESMRQMVKLVMGMSLVCYGLQAQATSSYQAGATCSYAGSNQSNSKTYKAVGAALSSDTTTACSVECPLTMTSNTNVLVSSGTVYYYNNGGTNANVAPTNCNLVGVSSTGSFYGSGTKY